MKMVSPRHLLVFAAALVVGILINTNVNAFSVNPNVKVDADAVKTGIFKVGYLSEANKIIKVLIEKGDKKYVYNLRNDGVPENFALQMGNGEYKASIYENISGNSYMPVYSEKLELDLKNDTIIYLNPIQNIYFDPNMNTIKKTIELLKNAKSDKEKLELIYKFVVPYLKYDYEKLKNINNLPNPYIPSIDTTYKARKGICYDYSSLFAAMLRYSGIPTKLMMGYTKMVKEYHAWNEVYLSDSSKWVVIDSTYDSCIYAAKGKYTMVKDTESYSAIKNY